jgi:hypothetical protein
MHGVMQFSRLEDRPLKQILPGLPWPIVDRRQKRYRVDIQGGFLFVRAEQEFCYDPKNLDSDIAIHQPGLVNVPIIAS